MENGDTIKTLTGEGNPRLARTRGIVALAVSCGLPLYGKHPLCDWVEQNEQDPEKLDRKHVWTFQGNASTRFAPDFGEETIEFNELARRFSDDEWCKLNSQHPIAYARAFFDQLIILNEALKPLKPCLKVSKGLDFVLIPQDASAEQRAEWIAMLDKPSV